MECYRKFYIHNFKFKPTSDFDDTLTNNGISIYEVIRIEQGIPLFLEDHLSRLFDSADISHLNINEGYCDFESLIAKLIEKNDTYEGKIKLIIHFDNGNHEKDLFIYFTPHYFPSDDEYKNGVHIGLCSAVRTNPNAKILNTEARKKANNTIVEKKYFEVLLMNNEGFITEGSRSNIFFIKDDKIITPPQKDVLNGIARRNILKICKQNKIKFIEERVHYSKIKEIDSIFLSGTSLKVLPVHRIESNTFNTNNSILKKIMELYDKSIQDYILSKQHH